MVSNMHPLQWMYHSSWNTIGKNLDIDFLAVVYDDTPYNLCEFFNVVYKNFVVNVIPRQYNSLLNVAAKTFEFMLQSTLHLGM